MQHDLPKRLLIANRGEVALRLQRAAEALGIETVAVFSEDDAASLHVHRAGETVALRGRGASAYLDVEAVVEAATASGADALHPGYGFLSERADLARGCEDRGVTFVGPRPETLTLFGDKARARELAGECDVPVLEGTPGAATVDEARELLESLGEGGAIMLKALAGGGGRGMRVVRRVEELAEAFERCRSEAEAAFGNGEVLAERLVEHARHVEVQVVGDGSGAVAELGERECSVQRRHQKLIEIAPSPWISASTRQRLFEAALRLAKHVRYRSLGTFEFLVDIDDESRVAFLEANPRLQVEHTVTEEVMGVDLVDLQLRLAGGANLESLGLSEGCRSTPRGHAIQLRINMETMGPDGEPRPTGGTIGTFDLPAGPGVRVDTFGYPGYRTQPSFDSLLAKVIVRSPSLAFEGALRRARTALSELHVGGVATNARFLDRLLQRPELLAGRVTTTFVERHIAELTESHGGDGRIAYPGAGPFVEGVAAESDDEDFGDLEVLRAKMPGQVARIDVAEGDRILAGQPVAVLESMKMEHPVQAADTGIARWVVAEGATVAEGDPLIAFEPISGEAPAAEPEAATPAADSANRAAWKRDLDEIAERRALVEAMGGSEGLARQQRQGKKNVRERIDLLVDSGSFREFAPFGGTSTYDGTKRVGFVPKVVVEGTCRIRGRRAVVAANDYSVRGGSGGSGGGIGMEMHGVLRAREWRVPYVRLVDGVGGSVKAFEGLGRTYLPDGDSIFGADIELLDMIPVVSTTLGVAAGIAAIQVALAHFSVMVKGTSQVFPGGPPVVRTALGLEISKEDLGGWRIHTERSGVVDNAVDTEEEAIEQTRRFLSYLPQNVWEMPPRTEPSDPIDRDLDDLLDLVPNDRRKPFDPHHVIERIVDQDSFFEIAPRYGRGRITGLARIGGIPFGLLANNPLHGTTGVAAGEKSMRLIRLCDTFHLPLVCLVDEPGFEVGPEAELAGIERAGARLVLAVSRSRMPWATVVLRRLFGVGGQSFHRASGMFQRYCWPTSRWGSMHIEGGARAAYKSVIESAEDPEAKLREIEERLGLLTSPFRTAESTGQEIIDPRRTRALLWEFLEDAWPVLAQQVGPPPRPYLP